MPRRKPEQKKALGKVRSNATEPVRSVRDRVSEAFKTARRGKLWTLEELASRIAISSRGEISSISTAHLSRIENNLARPSDEELYWINKVLGQPLGPIFDDDTKAYSYYIIKGAKALARLEEIRLNKRIIKRLDDAHLKMMQDRIYKYVPLEPDEDLLRPNESAALSKMTQLNRISLLQIEPAHDDLMLPGLDQHSGQEAIFCLEGDIDFWWYPPTQVSPSRHTLEPGDFVRFDSQCRHGFRAVGAEAASALHIYSLLEPEIRELVETTKAKSTTEG